jgi:hypothetical protein
MARRTRFTRRFLVLCVALVVTLPMAWSPPAEATGPCDNIPYGPPPDKPDPLIGGQITDAQSAGPIAGATVGLYRCSGTVGVYVTSATTNSGGNYAFASLASGYYYVEVVLSGPLTGMQPATGTSNPTNLVTVGNGDPAVNLDFW